MAIDTVVGSVASTVCGMAIKNRVGVTLARDLVEGVDDRLSTNRLIAGSIAIDAIGIRIGILLDLV